MKNKYQFSTLLVACLASLSSVFGAGEPSGNAVYAEHFAQGMIADGVEGPALQAGTNCGGGGLSMVTGDTSGNYYFVSVNECRVFWMNKDRVIRCIAGNGRNGFRDGRGDEAYFAFGEGMYVGVQICCDQKGNVYVADCRNKRFRNIYRKPDSTWWVATVAGGGTLWPSGTGIAGDKLGYIAPNFALTPDGSAIYYSTWNGINKVQLNSTTTASENIVYSVVGEAAINAGSGEVGGIESWKSAAYMTTDSQFYWMPGDPSRILRYDLKTGLVDRFAGFVTHYAQFDGTSRFDAGFHTVLLTVSPSGEVLFTACGDEAEWRRIYQDTVKHLLTNGTYRRQNDRTGGWCGSAQFIDNNGCAYSWGTNAFTRIVFEGSDTTPNHDRLGYLTVTLMDSLTQTKVTQAATVELLQNGVLVRKKSGVRGVFKLYADHGAGFTVNIAAAGYLTKTAIPVEILGGRTTNLIVQCTHAPVTGISIQPNPVTISLAATKQLDLYRVYSGGTNVLWDNSTPPAWTSRSPAIATVSNSGLVTSGAQEGTCVIVAAVASLGFADSVTVTVLGAYRTPLYHWKLDENSGTTASDASGNGNTGAFQGAPVWWGDGKFGSALSFNGTSDYLSTALQQKAPNVFSVALWFKTTSTTGGKLIGYGNAQIGVGDDYDREITMSNDGKLTFWVYNGGAGGNLIAGIDVLNDGQWHHAVGTLGTTGIKFYVDGALKGSGTAVRGDLSDGYWRIGYNSFASWQNLTSSYFKGQLDDIRIYNTVLSAADVSALQTDTATSYTEKEPEPFLPESLGLASSPNPFNPSVTIRVSGWSKGADLRIMDISGKVVANLTSGLNNGPQGARARQVVWNAAGHASGVYVILLKNGKMELKRKAMLIR